MNTGTYTVNGKTKHVTIRFRGAEWATGLPEGAMVVEYLAGPDNECDFIPFGFVIDGALKVWKKFTGKLEHQVWTARHLLGLDTERLHAQGYEYALTSGRCYVCGRVLTTPESIAKGIGPVCEGKEWS